MNRYLKAVLPTTTQWVAFLALPTTLTIYFFVSRYSNQFIQTQGIDYVAVQDNFLAQIFITGTVADFITRFMDFAFWGVLAAVGVLVAWGVSSTTTTIENHNVQGGFSNLETSKKEWREGLVYVAIIKALIVAVMVYAVVAIFVSATPRLAAGIAQCMQVLNASSVLAAIYGAAYLVALQALFIICIRLFKIVRAE